MKRFPLQINLLEKYQHQVLYNQIKRINILLNYNMVNFKETLVSCLSNNPTQLFKLHEYLKQEKLIQFNNH